MKNIVLVSFVGYFSASIAQAGVVPVQVKGGETGNAKVLLSCAYLGQTGPCFFDSGSGSSAIVYSAKTKVLPSVQKMEFGGAAGTSKICDEVEVPSLQLGTWIIKKVLAIRCPDSTPSNQIGMNVVLNESKFQLDLKKSEMRTGQNVTPAQTTESLTVLPQGHLTMKGKVGSQDIEALWDTGAGLSLVDLKYTEEHPENFEFMQEVPGADITGAPMNFKLLKAKNLEFGRAAFSEALVLAIPFEFMRDRISTEVKVIVGMNLIEGHIWTFDFTSKTWGVGP